MKASQVMALTGWNKNHVGRARLNGWIVQLKDENVFSDLLEIINHLFIKQNGNNDDTL